MSHPIRIAIVDDHALFLAGIARCFIPYPDFEIVAAGGSSEEACEIALRDRPDIMLLDIGIPGNGIKALATIVDAAPDVRVVMLTGSDDQDDIDQALQGGAQGYISKGVNGVDLIEALRTVLKGETLAAPEFSAGKRRRTVRERSVAVETSQEKELNNRDKEILGLIGKGMSNQEISQATRLSIRTIKHRLSLIYEKIGVRNRFEAAVYYLRLH